MRLVVAEALTNVAKHAGEASASVVATATDELTVSVTDDGPGGADATRGTGLAGLAERVETLGGWLSVQSASGHGTTVRATLSGRIRSRRQAPIVCGRCASGMRNAWSIARRNVAR